MNTPQLRMEHYNEELTSLRTELTKLSLEDMDLDTKKSDIVRRKDLTLVAIRDRLKWMSDEAAFIAEQKAANKKKSKKVAKKTLKKQAKKTDRKRK